MKIKNRVTETPKKSQKSSKSALGRATTVAGAVAESRCGKFQASLQNAEYFKHETAVALINSLREAGNLMKSIEDLQVNLVDKMNALTDPQCSVKYKLELTEKYVTLKCRSCGKFNAWF